MGKFRDKYLVDLPEFVIRRSYHHTGFQQNWGQMVRHYQQPGWTGRSGVRAKSHLLDRNH